MLAVGTVTSELFSASIPCYPGKIQGIFSIWGIVGPDVPR
jgi:hypothetical protein